MINSYSTPACSTTMLKRHHTIENLSGISRCVPAMVLWIAVLLFPSGPAFPDELSASVAHQVKIKDKAELLQMIANTVSVLDLRNLELIQSQLRIALTHTGLISIDDPRQPKGKILDDEWSMYYPIQGISYISFELKEIPPNKGQKADLNFTMDSQLHGKKYCITRSDFMTRYVEFDESVRLATDFGGPIDDITLDMGDPNRITAFSFHAGCLRYVRAYNR